MKEWKEWLEESIFRFLDNFWTIVFMCVLGIGIIKLDARVKVLEHIHAQPKLEIKEIWTKAPGDTKYEKLEEFPGRHWEKLPPAPVRGTALDWETGQGVDR